MSRVPIPPGNEEFKYKEQLYALFYELTSEVKGKDIELEEEDYINNIHRIKLPQLINYIRDTIQILIKQQTKPVKPKHIEQSKLQSSSSSSSLGVMTVEAYETIIQHQEQQERLLLKRHFEQKTIREIIENRLGDSLEIEKEYKDMKEKVKYEEGRFLSNERKDNEIIIIRAENTILKKTITELEENTKRSNDEIVTLKETIKEQKKEIDRMQKDLKMISNININISNSGNNNNSSSTTMNSTRCSLCGCISTLKSPDKTPLIDLNTFKKYDGTQAKGKKSQSKIKYNQLNRSTSHSHITFDLLTNKAPLTSKNTYNLHNNSTNILFDVTQRESLSKYYELKKNTVKKNKINPYCMKITKFPLNSNQVNQSRSLIGNNSSNNNNNSNVNVNISCVNSKREQVSSRIIDSCKKSSGIIVNKQNLNKSS